MILVTSHPPDFDITKEKSDLSKSPQFKKPFDSMFENAYKWLFNKIGKSELIWCYKDSGVNPSHGHERITWTLNVPDDRCIVINAHAWDCVINKWPFYKDELIKDISDEDYDKLMESLKGTEEKSWHDNIFNADGERVEVLIDSPVAKEFVIKTEWVCDYDFEMFKEKDGIIRQSYYDEKELNKYVEIYESALKGRKMDYKLSIKKSIQDNSFLLNIDW